MGFRRKLTIRGLDVFTDRPLSGNPTTVVLNADGLRDGDMQAVARELNLETTFVLQTTVAGADFQLRYFMPLREIELCGHGTIGAIWALAEEGLLQRGVSSVVVKTAVGSLKVALEWAREDLQNLVMDQLAPEFNAPTCSVEEVAQALGLAPSEIVTEQLPLMCASTGRAKLLIPIGEWKALDRIAVDERALGELCPGCDRGSPAIPLRGWGSGRPGHRRGGLRTGRLPRSSRRGANRGAGRSTCR